MTSTLIRKLSQDGSRGFLNSSVSFQTKNGVGFMNVERGNVSKPDLGVFERIENQFEKWTDQDVKLVIQNTTGSDVLTSSDVQVASMDLKKYEIPRVSINHSGRLDEFQLEADYKIAVKNAKYQIPVGLKFNKLMPYNNLDRYFAITQQTITPCDALHVGAMTHYCEEGRIKRLIEDLMHIRHEHISEVFGTHDLAARNRCADVHRFFSLERWQLEIIEQCFQENYSVHECVGALRAVDNEWAQNEAKRLEILYGKEIILEAEGEISALN